MKVFNQETTHHTKNQPEVVLILSKEEAKTLVNAVADYSELNKRNRKLSKMSEQLSTEVSCF